MILQLFTFYIKNEDTKKFDVTRLIFFLQPRELIYNNGEFWFVFLLILALGVLWDFEKLGPEPEIDKGWLQTEATDDKGWVKIHYFQGSFSPNCP